MRKLLFLMVVLLVMAGWTVAQTSSQPANQTGQTSTQSNQTGATGAQQNQTTPPATQAPADQTGATSSHARTGKLPATASPLPLLGILGIGSLGAGLVSRKRKK